MRRPGGAKPMFTTLAFVALVAATSGASAQEPAPAPTDDQVRVTAPPPSAAPSGPAAPPSSGSLPAAEKEGWPPKGGDENPTASGWHADEGFIVRSDDPAYKLRIGLQAAYKLEIPYQDGEFV